jgi:hypothetical protein
MSTLERLARRLTATERMAALVGGLVIAAMLSAIAVERMLASPPSPVVITLGPDAGAVGLTPPVDAKAASYR